MLQTNPGALCAKIIKIHQTDKNGIPGALWSQVSGLNSQPLTLNLSLSTLCHPERARQKFLRGWGVPLRNPKFSLSGFFMKFTRQSPPSTFLLSCPFTTTQPAMERYATVSFQRVFSGPMASFFLVPLAKRCVSHQNPLNTLSCKIWVRTLNLMNERRGCNCMKKDKGHCE